MTSISLANEAVIEVDPTPEVFLDRPFVFMIVDTEQALPIFMGRVNDLEGEEIPASAGGQQSQVPANPATQANGTYADSFKCGYLGDNPMKPGYLYLVSTEEEAEYVRKHMDSPANIGVNKLMKSYPLSDYSYLLLYKKHGNGKEKQRPEVLSLYDHGETRLHPSHERDQAGTDARAYERERSVDTDLQNECQKRKDQDRHGAYDQDDLRHHGTDLRMLVEQQVRREAHEVIHDCQAHIKQQTQYKAQR